MKQGTGCSLLLFPLPFLFLPLQADTLKLPAFLPTQMKVFILLIPSKGTRKGRLYSQVKASSSLWKQGCNAWGDDAQADPCHQLPHGQLLPKPRAPGAIPALRVLLGVEVNVTVSAEVFSAQVGCILQQLPL